MEDFFKREDLEISSWSGTPVSAWSLSMVRGVKIIHLGTGIVVTCESDRSQHKNRAIALRELEAKVLKAEKTARPPNNPSGLPESAKVFCSIELPVMNRIRDLLESAAHNSRELLNDHIHKNKFPIGNGNEGLEFKTKNF